MNSYGLQVWQMTVEEVKALIETNRQQTNRIAELEKDLALKTRDRDVFCDFTLAYEKRIEELEKDLHMIQRHYDQLETFSPSGNNDKDVGKTTNNLPKCE